MQQIWCVDDCQWILERREMGSEATPLGTSWSRMEHLPPTRDVAIAACLPPSEFVLPPLQHGFWTDAVLDLVRLHFNRPMDLSLLYSRRFITGNPTSHLQLRVRDSVEQDATKFGAFPPLYDHTPRPSASRRGLLELREDGAWSLYFFVLEDTTHSFCQYTTAEHPTLAATTFLHHFTGVASVPADEPDTPRDAPPPLGGTGARASAPSPTPVSPVAQGPRLFQFRVDVGDKVIPQLFSLVSICPSSHSYVRHFFSPHRHASNATSGWSRCFSPSPAPANAPLRMCRGA